MGFLVLKKSVAMTKRAELVGSPIGFCPFDFRGRSWNRQQKDQRDEGL